MNTSPLFALSDADLAAARGAGVLDTMNYALRVMTGVPDVASHTVNAGKEVAHYGALVFGVVGDLTAGGAGEGLRSALPRAVDGLTGRT